MTDREQIIAAAREAGFDVWIESVGPLPFWIERFYAIAFAAGAASRDAEIAELVAALESVIPEVAGGNTGLLAYNKCKAALAKVRKP